MCKNLHYEPVYFKELHNDQYTKWGRAVVTTITSLSLEANDCRDRL